MPFVHTAQLKLDSDLRVLAVAKYVLVLFGSAHCESESSMAGGRALHGTSALT